MLYIYFITNKIDGKMYVGYTTKGEKRWATHLRVARGGKDKYPSEYSYIHKAINKYHVDNFVFQPIEYYSTIEELKEAEIFWISYLKSIGTQLYNLTNGGDGVAGRKRTDEERKTISEKMTGKFLGDKNPFYGKTHSDKSKMIISATRLENKNNSKYWGENVSQSIFNEEEIKTILDQYYMLNFSTSQIARNMHAKTGTIKSIISGRTWQKMQYDLDKNPRTRHEGQILYLDEKYGEKEIIERACQECGNIMIIKIRKNAKKGRDRKFCGNACKLSNLNKISN